MKKKVIIGSFLPIVIVGFVLGFTSFNSSKSSSIKYKTEAVDKGDIQDIVVTTGILNPVTLVDVGSQVSGTIENTYVDFNSEVKAGQVIAKIDPSSFLTKVHQSEANYKSAIASLKKAKVTAENLKNKYERSLELFNKNLISYEEKENSDAQYLSSEADLQSAEAKLAQAKSQLESSQVDLAHTIIKSPIDGIVINKNVNVGQTIAASLQAPVLFQIANDLSEMQVECSVDEADIGKVKENQKVTFTVDAYPEESFTGTVKQIRYSPEIIQNVVTYTTIVEVENQDMKLRPGMTATVSVVVDEATNSLRVPNSALRFTPQLSTDETKIIFGDIRDERQTGNIQTFQADEQDKKNQRSQLEGQVADITNSDVKDTSKTSISRIWIINENGKLKPISIKTGVADSSHTEVSGGGLQEGQKVITGLASGAESSQNSKSNDSMRNMTRALRKKLNSKKS
jgi:HlyD family secretion protein